jgi:hypothetical protein
MEKGGMKTSFSFQNAWEQLLALLPAGRDEAAREHHALVRKRQINDADTLLRLAFVYAWGGLSLRNTVAWAEQAGVATLSDVALLERLQKAHAWLGWLLAQTLHAQVTQAHWPAFDFRVRLVDATAIAKPGSQGTDWRVHLGMNLTEQTCDFIQVTDVQGGETFTRFPAEAGDLLVADRGYAHRTGIASVVAKKAHVLVRFTPQNLPLQQRDGTPFDVLAALRTLLPGQIGTWDVQTAPGLRPGTPAVSGRVIALRRGEAQAEAARRRLNQTARRKGRRVQAVTLEYAEYLLLFTTLSEEALSAQQALGLYRFRWQIECGFKRLKSLLDLDGLQAMEARLCRTYLYCKLIGALLLERLASSWATFSPWEEAGGVLDLACGADALVEFTTRPRIRTAALGLAGHGGTPAPRLLRTAA